MPAIEIFLGPYFYYLVGYVGFWSLEFIQKNSITYVPTNDLNIRTLKRRQQLYWYLPMGSYWYLVPSEIHFPFRLYRLSFCWKVALSRPARRGTIRGTTIFTPWIYNNYYSAASNIIVCFCSLSNLSDQLESAEKSYRAPRHFIG